LSRVEKARKFAKNGGLKSRQNDSFSENSRHEIKALLLSHPYNKPCKIKAAVTLQREIEVGNHEYKFKLLNLTDSQLNHGDGC
jgi:hypothetical protein